MPLLTCRTIFNDFGFLLVEFYVTVLLNEQNAKIDAIFLQDHD